MRLSGEDESGRDLLSLSSPGAFREVGEVLAPAGSAASVGGGAPAGVPCCASEMLTCGGQTLTPGARCP